MAEALGLPPAIPAAHTPEDTRLPCPKCQTLTTSRKCPYCDAQVPQPYWRLPADSDIRETAMKITAFRLGGMTDERIAEELGIAYKSIKSTIFRAGKNGWMDYTTTREAIENGLAHKVIRNLNAMLDDSSNPDAQREVTLKVAEHTIFKEFGAEVGAGMISAPQTAISIRIEHPAVIQPIREGTIGGLLGAATVEVIDGDAATSGPEAE